MLPAPLRRELEQNLVEVRKQIGVVKDKASELGIPAENMQNPDGTYTMTPLLVAKAQILNGLAVLHGR